MAEKPIKIGVIGCGGFGQYALQQFSQIPGTELIGMASTFEPAAEAAAKRLRIPDFGETENLVERNDVDLIYIATPPFLHHEQAMAALCAGKHVITEKPFAMDLDQADEMIATAHENDLLVVADLMQRYNPLYYAVREIIETGPLGQPLHAYFENYAADEGLNADHWFWDRDKSGGIFVEHSVHFFDLFTGWFGEGTVEAAQNSFRPNTNIEEQVQCTIRYDDTILVNFYHGFHQPYRMDRQEIRILFERGDVTLEEWVPTRIKIRAILDESAIGKLRQILPDATFDCPERYPPGYRACRGRHKDLDVVQFAEITQGQGLKKYKRYGRLLRALFEDQIAWIRDRNHERVITEENGRQSLADALAADQLITER
ncbi:MAG: Gfo/Idh/MocA family protein [Candidatus Brocadiia bacterium]